jgi:gliding motility-associated-like protein
VIPNTGTAISSFRLDGVTVPASNFTVHPFNSGYSYAIINVSGITGVTGNTACSAYTGPYGISHLVESDSGFNAIAYGYGAPETYGYNAGTNIRDIYQYVTIQNQYATINFPATCRNTPFYFTMTFPYQPTSIEWNFGTLFPPPNNTFSMPNPALYFIGTIVVNGRLLYQYRIPNPYTATVPAGIYPIQVTAINPTPDGCGNTQEINYDLQVFAQPTADFTFNVVCFNQPTPFFDNSNTGGRPIMSRYWDFGDASTSTLNNPTHLYAGLGPYNVKYSIITDVGCLSDTAQHMVTVNPLPTATIAGTIEVCRNATPPDITFTGAGATAPYTFTYTINGGPNQTVTSVGNTATVSVPTTTAGTYTYTLISVQDASATTCSQLQSGTAIVTVNPLPTATIAGTIEVCRNATPPDITFTGAGATAPYTFTYTINGGPNQTVTSVGNTATVSVPTTTAGTYTYTLISVQDASATTCSQLQSGSATVIVHPLPTSNFSFTIPSCETRTISFTDLSVPNVGSLTTWTWNFGDGSPPVTINAPASPNISHTFATAGTYNVLLVVTNDKGCVSVTPAQPVTIHSRPLAGYIIPEVCLTDTYAQFIDTSSVSAPDIITAWQWNFGDPVSGPLNVSTLQNPQHSYSAVGPYNVELIVTSNIGCRDTIVQQLFVNGSFPVAAFTVPNPATLCANDSVSIVEASTVFPGTITKVEIYWDNVGQPAVFDIDNFPVSGKVYKHLYPNFQAPLTRTFTIRYRAYSGGVCVDDTLKNITVNAAPLVQFNNMPNVCLDATPFQITQASETGGVPGTGVFSGPGVTPGGIFNPASVGPGTHTILYTFTSTTGGCVDTMSNTITVWLPPIADFSSSTPACETKAITFTDNSNTPVGTLTTWTWNFGDGTPVVVRNNNLPFTHIFANWGTYNVTLFVTTSNGCRSVVKTTAITINPQPKPNFSTPASSCLPDATVPFTNLTTIADGSLASCTYLWNFGDPGSGANNTSTLANPSHVYTTTGPFSVNLQVTSGNGCVQDITIQLTTVHPQPLASFITDKIDVCIGSSITFTNTSNPMDGVITQYNWAMGDGNTQSTPTFAYTYSALGTYNVSLFIFNNHGCRSTTYSQTVYVNPYPLTDAGPDKFMLEGGQVMLTPVLVTNMTVSYLWSPPQYLNNPAIPNTIASPPDDKYYTLTITSDKGCSTSDVVFIKVLKMPAIPNIFSPNGDGVHDKWVIDYLDSYSGCTVDIFNRYGQRIFHSEGYANPWDGTINGQPVPVGTYYYIVNPKNGRKIMSGYVDVIR